MAEEDSSQEKTQEATPRKKQKARDDGQIPRSRELTTTAVLLAGTLGLYIFGGMIIESLAGVLRFNFTLERETVFDPELMFAQLGHSFYEALFSLLPFFAMVVFAACVAPIALGGWLFSGKALMPKLNRIDPVGGLKRMFSAKSLVELVKSIAKVLVVITVAYLSLQFMQADLLGLSREGISAGMRHSLELSIWAAILISASTLIIAFIDVPYQIWDHAKKLKMSMQEIKDEMKDTEGKPEVKGRIRQLQRQMATNRMMAAVPEADVVITNPTHFSVALRYDPATMDTPIVLAKGVDHMAMKIREVARAHKIEFVQSPVLARAIYHTTEVDAPIPAGLYVAVAQVLAYVFQLRNFRKGRGDRPPFPRNLPIPPDMVFK